jgi:spore coat polysaccharide biosynthesis protein SpsF (cytidylyltransferase family)
MGATRLPGKVMMEIDGVPLLEIMLSRVSKSKLINKAVVAISKMHNDDQIEEFCIKNGYECFRGSENDVLSRYYECAKKYNADMIIRLTADCPLIDPSIIDNVIKLFCNKNVDYAANTVPPETSTFPDGSDVEVFSFKALERANAEASDPKDREHVTFYFWKYNNGFKTVQLNCNEDWSKYRFTVDYPEDFDVIKFIMKELSKRNIFGHLKDIIEIFDLNPEIKQKNEKYYFGIGWE